MYYIITYSVTLVQRNIYAGVFNICNKLLVTLDVLLDMRHHVQKGEPPSNSAQAIFDFLSPSIPAISHEQRKYLEQKLYDGYFAFEASTDRDWDEEICGICGSAPVFMSGDGNSKNCTPLRKNQVFLTIEKKIDIYIVYRKYRVVTLESSNIEYCFIKINS